MKKQDNQIKIYNHNGIGVFIFLIVFLSLGSLFMIVIPFFEEIDMIAVMFGILTMFGGLALSIWLCVKCVRNKTIIDYEKILFYIDGQLVKTIEKNAVKKLVVVIVPFRGFRVTHSIVLDDGTFVFKHPYSFTNKAMFNESYVLLNYRKRLLTRLQDEFSVPTEILDTCNNFSFYKHKDDN